MLRIALMALVARGAGLQQQQGSIEGVVVKMGSGEPLADANVQLHLDGDSVRMPQVAGPPPLTPEQEFHRYAKTGRDGKFVFEKVTPGLYQLIATRAGGYAPSEYGQRSASGAGLKFQIAPGQKMTGVQLAMTPTGAISGQASMCGAGSSLKDRKRSPRISRRCASICAGILHCRQRDWQQSRTVIRFLTDPSR